MVAIRYARQRVELKAGESVLDALLRNGIVIQSGCRSGVCQTCLMQAISGSPPSQAQQGLRDSLKQQNYFLACVCLPSSDMDVALPGEQTARLAATVKALTYLNDNILQVSLAFDAPLTYRAGQFLNVFRDDGLARSYSIASVPHEDEHIHLHIRRLPEGQMSTWIHDQLTLGDKLEIEGPAGDCFYIAGDPSQPLLLLGTGSGLAPLYGIVRDALSQGHTGPIRLFHGSREPEGLYLLKELGALAAAYANFEYWPCLSGRNVPKGFNVGRVDDLAFQAFPELKHWRLFLCGHPDMVKQAQRRAFLAGARLKEIYSDPFHATPAKAMS